MPKPCFFHETRAVLLKFENIHRTALNGIHQIKLQTMILGMAKKKIIHSYSDQELMVIALIAEGNTNAEVADYLNIAENTVKTHRRNILKKSNAANFYQVISRCIRDGLI